MISLKLPTSITVKRKTKPNKKYSLNLNVYRNLHFQINNKLKKEFRSFVEHQLPGEIPISTPINLDFFLTVGSKRRVDSSNFYCVIEKYLCDALVEMGVIDDDNDFHIGTRTYHTSQYRKNENYCLVLINESKV